MSERSPGSWGPSPRSVSRGESESTSRSEPSPIRDLLVIFLVVYVLQWITALFGLGVMTGLFVLSPPIDARPWTVVTSVYAHGGFGHLLSNSVALVLFGWPIARATTRLRFHAYFLATGAVAGVSQIVVTGLLAMVPFLSIAPTPGVLGASGAVFALLGYLLASNRLSDSFASVIDVPWWVSIGVFLVLATIVTLATARPRVALVAHFTGFFAGLIAGRAGVLESDR
ncbi:rhomboid family intramembrane serine protease [Halosolutus gelatinilyticus]|uniref:rhomboid family intramembrane serine protease n=1 Tax=Halosolutus gelatinilyticus TaxID=2931975 RepID=UPI001FF133C5|nr:rhomboid family intramembrane serine protease [Halosolutus gelatinilyticus]